MNNKITDLNNHLFAELERLSDESLEADQLKSECNRASAICDVAEMLLQSSKVSLAAAKLRAEYGDGEIGTMPTLLESK